MRPKDLTSGHDLSTNRGYNKRIPPNEGGVLDQRGQQTRGEHFEGKGGPEDSNDNDVVPARVPNTQGLGSLNDSATEGQQASRANVGSRPPGPGGSAFKGSDYYTPESVPDSISAEGNIAPGSVTQASREAEGY
ncbi:hypothetical protein CDD81_427 [Ophiocordyceps australis]|uniref:Uncharacterized protein n=1 Tax=Ophiocordyceps australis TaxID=1399860 RepID=A0A2C5Y2E0_9HYPO|nr:hypothetical protein CDD81_427 [Ophiocordyceps australis]